MNPILIMFFAMFLLVILFFSLYSLFKIVFLSISQGIGVSLSSSPPGISYNYASELAYLAIFAGIISVVIVILIAAWRIRKKIVNFK